MPGGNKSLPDSIMTSVKFSRIHMRAISRDLRQSSVIMISLKITYIKFNLNPPGAN